MTNVRNKVDSFAMDKISGGDDRIRTCEGLLTLNGLANRRLQPLGHISVPIRRRPILVGSNGLSSEIRFAGAISPAVSPWCGCCAARCGFGDRGLFAFDRALQLSRV